MITIRYEGRLGNNLFQYVAAFIFAKKNNIKICTDPPDTMFNLLTCEGEIYNSDNVIEINDDNFLHYLYKDTVEKARYHFNGYFQLKDFVLNFRREIGSVFSLQYLQRPANEVFVAYRIGDIANLPHMLPVEYYRYTLKQINADTGFITSDTPSHPNVLQLAQEFNLKPYYDTPCETINFGKDFNNIVLSEGTFSWWIGFLSKTTNVYYNDRKKIWHGDIFVMPEWLPINIKY